STLYTPALGFGWQTPALELDRGGASDLRRDFHYGTDNTFRVQGTPGVSYTVRAYLGDAGGYHDTITLSAEGVVAYPVAKLPAGTTDVRAFTITSADDVLTIRFNDLGGRDPNFVVNGLDVFVTGSPDPGVQPQRAADVRTGRAGRSAAVLTAAELAPVVEAALARLAAAGVDAERLGVVRQTTFTIADLRGVGLLGPPAPGVPQV